MANASVIDPRIVSLDSTADVGLLGLKGWYLSRLRENGFEVPAGFVIPTTAYDATIRAAHVDHRLHRIWSSALDATATDIPLLARTARHLISQVELSGDLLASMQRALVELTSDRSASDAGFAVRSSVASDAVSAPECAGVHTSYTNVHGADHIASRVRGCWASLYGERALTMRSRGLGAADPAMAVVVQRMVAADKSGLAIPLGESNDLLVEATFGLGEPIISGAVEPDRYVLDRLAPSPISISVGRKRVMLSGRGAGHSFMPDGRQDSRVLDDDEIRRIGRLSASVDSEFRARHEVEWALRGDDLYVLQIRALSAEHEKVAPSIDGAVTGVGVGVGTATGPVHCVARLEDAMAMRDGDVLVTPTTTPEWTPHILRAAALVTDDGDRSCHASRVAREHGIPAVVGTRSATTLLENGRVVTVDPERGWVLPTGLCEQR